MSTVYVYTAPFFPSLVEQTGLSNSPCIRRPKKLAKKNLYNSSLYLSSTQNERKVNIPNWHHQLEEIRVHPSVRTLASACSKRSANSAWHHPIHQNIAGRNEFHLIYIGNKKKRNLPALGCMRSISHSISVILTTNDEQKNIFQTVTIFSGQDQDIKCKGGEWKGLKLHHRKILLHSTYMLTNTMTIGRV